MQQFTDSHFWFPPIILKLTYPPPKLYKTIKLILLARLDSLKFAVTFAPMRGRTTQASSERAVKLSNLVKLDHLCPQPRGRDEVKLRGKARLFLPPAEGQEQREKKRKRSRQ